MKKFLTLLFLFIVSNIVVSQSTFDAKSLLSPRIGKQKLVNDFANVLTNDQQQTLENKLVQFDDSTSTQLSVVIIPNLGNYDISDYALKLGRAWGVGGKEFNNGIVLLISKDDRKINISTGYGVEGALPDITCHQIITQLIGPRFKGEDFYGGINSGVDAIIKATKGEYKAPEGYSKRGKQGKLSLGRIIFLIVMVIVLLSIFGGGNSGGTFMSRRGFIPMIFPGGGGGFSGGGGSSGGGGFGGFGGGSFGGGGSSGSW